MLVSSNKVLLAIRTRTTEDLTQAEQAAYGVLKQWFTNLVNSPISRPSIKIEEEERAVALYCTEELWLVIQRWKSKSLTSMGFLDFVKLWKEVKPILEKGEKDNG